MEGPLTTPSKGVTHGPVSPKGPGAPNAPGAGPGKSYPGGQLRGLELITLGSDGAGAARRGQPAAEMLLSAAGGQQATGVDDH